MVPFHTLRTGDLGIMKHFEIQGSIMIKWTAAYQVVA